MADKQSVCVRLSSATGKKLLRTSLNRAKRNKTRRCRRKRNRLRYLHQLKQVRIARYEEVQMECGAKFEPVITDVAEWQNVHQAAYWKSRAISLEYENRMLHDLLRKMQLKTLGDVEEATVEEGYEEEAEDGASVDEETLPPRRQTGESEAERSKELYGNSTARISGMQTAVQLNYDYLIEKFNPTHWPNLPLKL